MSLGACCKKISEPTYYHREYKNDTGEKVEELSWKQQCQRVANVTLPFFSLYKPLSLPISLGMGALRAWSSINQLFASVQHGNSKEIPFHLLQSTIAVVALGGTIFAHPAGMLITTGHDLIIETVGLIGYLQKGEHQKAIESCANIINNALYLALFTHGGLELGIASFAMQVMLGLYHSHGQFQKGNYLEASGHLLMAMIRGNQLADQAKLLQAKWEIEGLLKQVEQVECKKAAPEELGQNTKSKALLILDNSKSASSKAGNLTQLEQTMFDQIKKSVGATTSENQELVDILLKYGNNPDNIPVLHYAVKVRDYNSVKVLVANGSNINVQSRLGTPLNLATQTHELNMMKFLVSNGAQIDERNVEIAASSNFIEGLDFLLEQKPVLVNGGKLLFSLIDGNVCDRIIINLINYGVDCKYVSSVSYYDRSNRRSFSENIGLMTGAVSRGNIEIVKLLYERGAPINYCTNFTSPVGMKYYFRDEFFLQYNPLFRSVISGHPEIAKYLVSNGASITLLEQQMLHNNLTSKGIGHSKNIITAYQCNALQQNHLFNLFDYYIKHAQLTEVIALYEAGAVVRDHHLAEASKRGYRELVAWLIEHGAKP